LQNENLTRNINNLKIITRINNLKTGESFLMQIQKLYYRDKTQKGLGFKTLIHAIIILSFNPFVV